MGFRSASEHVQDLGVRSMFNGIARRRGQFADELKREVERLGGAPEEGGSLAAAVHRGWMDMRSAVSRRDDHAMLAEAARGEESAVKVYEAVLHLPLPPATHAIVEAQYKQVQDACERVRGLEREWKHRR
jgi:uncharacterized protein (TIGR02284 family)